jgi:hypothetical protein
VTSNAWIMLLVVWGLVGGFTLWLVAKVLATPPKD